MRFFTQKSFAHGIHPPESKAATAGMPIRQFPFSPLLTIPLSQHLGRPALAIVREGEEVTRGQRVAKADGAMSVAMHAPASGVIKAIGHSPSAKGAMVPSLFLAPHPASTQEVAEGRPCHPEQASPKEILQAVQDAGIVGLGGAAFPTHIKLKVPDDKTVDTLIVNGAECEPFLTTDHRVMLEQAADVVHGIRYLQRITGAKSTLIGLEANKADAAETLRAALPDELGVEVVLLEVKYPQGAEKMLISALLGREVPSGGLPSDAGALCINVATTAEMGRLLPHGRGIQERVITISGPGVKDPGNYRIPIGTPLSFILETVGVTDDLSRVFMGGPMMGPAVANLELPVVKGTSGIVAFTEAETGPMKLSPELPCIRCARCLDACPLSLNPSLLGLWAKNEQHERMAEEAHLMDCFECGACSFVCPSRIPLVHHFRVAKAAVRKARASS